jgi:hypothetical protein
MTNPAVKSPSTDLKKHIAHRPEPKPEGRLSPLEIAVLWFIQRGIPVGETFQIKAADFTKSIKVGERWVQLTLRELLALGYLEEVSARRRDVVNRFWIPAVYRLLKTYEPEPQANSSQVNEPHANNSHSKTKDLLPTCEVIRTEATPLCVDGNNDRVYEGTGYKVGAIGYQVRAGSSQVAAPAPPPESPESVNLETLSTILRDTVLPPTDKVIPHLWELEIRRALDVGKIKSTYEWRTAILFRKAEITRQAQDSTRYDVNRQNPKWLLWDTWVLTGRFGAVKPDITNPRLSAEINGTWKGSEETR